MSPSNPFLSAVPLHQLYVWVLAPHLESKDANIDYYYDFSQSIAEYTKTFNELGVDWKWQPVTINNYAKIIDTIVAESEAGSKMHVVFNLCDGDEVNGTPGISVVRLLEEKGLLYTGSDEYFYDITTSKIPMKKAFDQANIPTAPWQAILSREQNIDTILETLGSPVIVKPSVSGGSMGVGVRNVVSSTQALHEQVQQMFDGYRGWQLTSDGIIAESFITGPEYTVLIVGSYDKPGKAKIYEPVERVFHPSLPDKEKFLSFDRLWEIYEEEQPMPDEGNFYEYALPDKTLMEDIKRISWDAFVATKGKGYTRVDLRMDTATGQLYVLEINAQCGLSEDEDYTSIGAILRLSGKTFTQLVVAIINDAYQRKKVAAKALKRKGSLGIS
jgi:D-alanine-D-alanine ligase